MKLNKLILILWVFVIGCSQPLSHQQILDAEKYMNKTFVFDNREYVVTNVFFKDDTIYWIKATTTGCDLYLTRQQFNSVTK